MTLLEQSRHALIRAALEQAAVLEHEAEYSSHARARIGAALVRAAETYRAATEERRAYHSDGSRVTDRDVQVCGPLADHCRNNGLTVLCADEDGNEIEEAL